MITEKRGSAGKPFGWHTIYEPGSTSPYMTRIWIGRLRLHIFHRGDLDPDCHDHPWDFWTFPLTSYVEEVAEFDPTSMEPQYGRHIQIVPAFRLTFRPATHCHRVLGRHRPAKKGDVVGIHYTADGGVYDTSLVRPGKIVTLVWRSRTYRSWGFLKTRDGRWCWTAWRDYVFGGGKDAPCSDEVSK